MGVGMSASQRLYFLMFTADGADGICRSVATVANGLADRYRIELISLYRRRKSPRYDLDPRIVVTDLHDARPVGPRGNRHGGRVRIKDHPERDPEQARLDSQPSRLVGRAADPHMSLLTDTLLEAKLRTLEPGILVSTRPSLHAAAAEYAPAGMITIAQDHQNFVTRMPALRKLIQDSSRRLDCLVTLADADRCAYAQALAGSTTVVEAIPNAVPWTFGPTSTLDSKIVVSGGRLVTTKGFDRLVRGFEPVARARPDWRLHIYGLGDQGPALRQLIRQLRLGDQVELMGQSDRFREALAGASVFASGSHTEGFPMVMLEAMSVGLPAVAFDVPSGPADLIEDGVNGYLVNDGDLEGFSGSLRRIIENVRMRRRMGDQAFRVARRYDIGSIVERWETLFDRLERRSAGTVTDAERGSPPGDRRPFRSLASARTPSSVPRTGTRGA